MPFAFWPGRQPKPAAPQLPSFVDVEHEGASYRIALKRVATARRFTLRVRVAHHDVVLTMPPRGSLKVATAFARKHAEWIVHGLSRLDPAIRFRPGIEVPLRGVPHRLVQRAGLRHRVWAEHLEGDDGPSLCVSGPEARFGTAVAAFLRREAAQDYAEAVDRHTRSVGRSAQVIRLRDTRSRWGSCSSAGTLNFSWRLILAPPFVLDYLAAHEVAHLVHMNHSEAFWGVTHRLAPQTAQAEAWLKANGPGLHRYGP